MRYLMLMLTLLVVQGCTGPTRKAVAPEIKSVPVFTAEGEVLDWAAVYAAMDEADVVVVGESHTDRDAHALQVEMIHAATSRWDDLTLSVEEFDRSQQTALTAFQRGEINADELRAERQFVDPRIKRNWMDWYYPKLEAARDGGATLLASNAPTQYSRLVRNYGCDNLPELDPEELALFDCPRAELDQAYKQRFNDRLKRVSGNNRRAGLKPLKEEQTERMFRAQRVWDATMAESIVAARKESGDRVLHLVGAFHSDFEAGLMDELRLREPGIRILVLSMITKRGPELQESDVGKADIIIYTRG